MAGICVAVLAVGCWKRPGDPRSSQEDSQARSSNTNQTESWRSQRLENEPRTETLPADPKRGTSNSVPERRSTPLSGQDIYERARAAFVFIEVERNEGMSIGSGFIVRPGLIVTNRHVVSDARGIMVRRAAASERPVVAEVRAVHETVDLAVIASNLQHDGLPLARDHEVRVGQEVYVLGNPGGLEATFTDGRISQKRTVESNRVLQISAPVSKGSSGGPVMNNEGQVVGVVFALQSEGQNLNFAVPVSYVREMLRRQNAL